MIKKWIARRKRHRNRIEGRDDEIQSRRERHSGNPRSAAIAAENDMRVLAALVQAREVVLRPGELVRRAGLAPATSRAAVRRLIGRGLVDRDGKRWIWATQAGRDAAIGRPSS
jgi:predicted DNA-binding transcriptional regulator